VGEVNTGDVSAGVSLAGRASAGVSRAGRASAVATGNSPERVSCIGRALGRAIGIIGDGTIGIIGAGTSGTPLSC
jgi:hypothetical protein